MTSIACVGGRRGWSGHTSHLCCAGGAHVQLGCMDGPEELFVPHVHDHPHVGHPGIPGRQAGTAVRTVVAQYATVSPQSNGVALQPY
jgi:hypothetical protein